jgi:serine phosphatase RsbU (regulator of sigma subunit)
MSATTITSPNFFLDILAPGGEKSRVELADERVLVGRSAGAAVRLPSDSVSRRHAELYRDPFGRWWVRDLASRNGTSVNGDVVDERLLAPGDAIGVGEFSLRFASPSLAPSQTSDSSTSVPLLDTAGGKVNTLHELDAPRIRATHLAALAEFGNRLSRLEEPARRLAELCLLMVNPEFRGRSSIILRTSPARPDDPPIALADPIFGAAAHRAPYLSRTLLQAVSRRRESVLASNLASGNIDLEVSISPSIVAMSAVACPLRSDDQALDLLYVELPPECGTAEWLALATLAVDQYVHAEAAWDARRRAQANAAIEAELQKAAELQRRLVPTNIKAPGLDIAVGFQPCRWVGGDYVDVVPLADGRVILAIADVCGKGLAAALSASSLHTIIHSGLGAGLDPARLPAMLNEHLRRVLPPGHFVTFVHAIIDPSVGRITSATFGHPAPRLLDRSLPLRELHTGQNMPMGLGPLDIEWADDQISPGQLLAMFTDGLFELTDITGKQLGLAALGDLLHAAFTKTPEASADTLAQNVWSGLARFHGQALAGDDRTFLLLQRQ